MKTKKSNKKLQIKKTTIATLNNLEKKGVMAGLKACTEFSGCNTELTCVSDDTECECNTYTCDTCGFSYSCP